MSGDGDEPLISDLLVDQLSPPIYRPVVENWLATIRADLERADARAAIWESQKTPDAQKQLYTVRVALEKLGPRAASEFCRQLDQALAETFPQLLVFSPPDFEPGVGSPDEELFQTLVTALGRASAVMVKRTRGHDGKISRPAAVAAVSLANLYCEAHEVPFPTFDAEKDECRYLAAARFALDCLSEWRIAGADDLTEESLVRSFNTRGLARRHRIKR